MMISSAEAGGAAGAATATGAAGAVGAVIGAVLAASVLDVCVCWQAVSNTDTDIAAKYNLSFIALFFLSWNFSLVGGWMTMPNACHAVKRLVVGQFEINLDSARRYRCDG